MLLATAPLPIQFECVQQEIPMEGREHHPETHVHPPQQGNAREEDDADMEELI